jgi:large conductance mechanosensitive channel protein
MIRQTKNNVSPSDFSLLLISMAARSLRRSLTNIPIARDFNEQAPLLGRRMSGYIGTSYQRVNTFWGDFIRFVQRGPVVDLGVGIIIASVFGDLTRSLMDDILSPPIGLAFGSSLVNVFIVLKQGKTPDRRYNTLEEARNDGAVTENVGIFLQQIIRFFIICFILYWVIRGKCNRSLNISFI